MREALPDVPLEQRTTDELAKRVRKLRWMGFEEEANRLQRILSDITPARRVLTAPYKKTNRAPFICRHADNEQLHATNPDERSLSRHGCRVW